MIVIQGLYHAQGDRRGAIPLLFTWGYNIIDLWERLRPMSCQKSMLGRREAYGTSAMEVR